MLYCKFSLVAHFIQSSVTMSIPIFQFILVSFLRRLDYKFNYLNGLRTFQADCLILFEFWQFAVFEELVYFSSGVECMCIQRVKTHESSAVAHAPRGASVGPASCYSHPCALSSHITPELVGLCDRKCQK